MIQGGVISFNVLEGDAIPVGGSFKNGRAQCPHR